MIYPPKKKHLLSVIFSSKFLFTLKQAEIGSVAPALKLAKNVGAANK